VSTPLVAQSRGSVRNSDPRVRRLVAEAHVLSTVGQQLVRRVADRVVHGRSDGPDGAVLKLARGVTEARLASIALELAGTDGVVASGAPDAPPGAAVPANEGVAFLMRQTRSLAGGSNEMQRNLISERLLGMPRELAPDAGVPFSQVRADGTSSEAGRR
jgi:alkylation response protein AidB-like acyl-CoA dehydrogenase